MRRVLRKPSLLDELELGAAPIPVPEPDCDQTGADSRQVPIARRRGDRPVGSANKTSEGPPPDPRRAGWQVAEEQSAAHLDLPFSSSWHESLHVSVACAGADVGPSAPQRFHQDEIKQEVSPRSMYFEITINSRNSGIMHPLRPLYVCCFCSPYAARDAPSLLA